MTNRPTPIENPLLYRINSILHQKFPTQQMRTLKKRMILERTGMSESSWVRIVGATYREKQPLDAYDMYQISEELGVEMKELLNPELI